MNKFTIGVCTVFFLYGCSGTPSKSPETVSSNVKTHVFPAGNNKQLSFKSTGCTIGEGTLKNNAEFASAGSYGTLLVANSKSQETIDQYRVSCSAIKAGGTSSCVIQRVQGTGRAQDFGGENCPEMKFQLINFRSF